MERRFKIGLVSMNEVSDSGEGFGKVLKSSLPDGTQILDQESDFDTASLKILLFNPEWDERKLGANIEKFVIKLKAPEKRVKIAYNH